MNNGRWQKMLWGVGGTILTGLVIAGIVSILETSRQVDRVDERFINLSQRDAKQTEFILDHNKRLAELWEHQMAQDRTFADIYKRLDVLEAQQGEILKQLWRLQKEGTP